MRWPITLLGTALLVLAPAAGADEYRLLEGTLVDATSGVEVPLRGDLQLEPLLVIQADGSVSTDGPGLFQVASHAILAGSRVFSTAPRVRFEGVTAVGADDSIRLNHVGDEVVRFLLESNGEEVPSEGSDRIWRRFEWRASDASVLGDRGPGGVPLRFELRGTLTRVDERWRVEAPAPLPPPVVLPPGDGGIVLGGGSVRIGGDGLSSLTVTAASLATAPTLDSLAITAPAGALLTIEADGGVIVRTEGDLEWRVADADLEGVNRLALSAFGRVVVTGSAELPSGFELHIEGAEAVIDGGFDPGDAPCCLSIRPIATERTPVGEFRFVVARLQQVEIELAPTSEARVHGRRGGRAHVAWLGSADLDVRDVLEATLRFGSNEAPAVQERSRRSDIDGDGFDDLIVRVRLTDTGIGADAEDLCASGESARGPLLVGCAALESTGGPRAR